MGDSSLQLLSCQSTRSQLLHSKLPMLWKSLVNTSWDTVI